MSRRTYSDEERAAVLAALLTGQSITQVAAAYKIPVGTVKKWSASRGDTLEGTGGEPAGTTKKAIGELLVEYLSANLTALRVQVQAFSDPVWLAKQSASDVAVLHGVMTDKAVRLLEALGGPDGADAGAAE